MGVKVPVALVPPPNLPLIGGGTDPVWGGIETIPDLLLPCFRGRPDGGDQATAWLFTARRCSTEAARARRAVTVVSQSMQPSVMDWP